MEAKFIEHKNQKILYIDQRGAKTEEELLDLLHQGVKMHEKAGSHTGIMVNFENGFFTRKFADEIKTYTKNQPGKKALIGVTGVMKVIVSGINMLAGHKDVELFDTEEEAKEWLVS